MESLGGISFGYAELATVKLSQHDEARQRCHTGSTVQLHHGKGYSMARRKKEKELKRSHCAIPFIIAFLLFGTKKEQPFLIALVNKISFCFQFYKYPYRSF